MASVRRSLVLSFAQKYSTMAIQIVSTMILARLLTPGEIGIFSVGVAIAGMAHVLREFGVGNYLIQERELTPDRIRTAFGLALVIAWTMAGVLFLLSGPLSAFYDEPGVRQVMMVLSINFVLIPFNSPVLALLRREMNFGALFFIHVASAFAGAATSVSLATLGFGFVSLAWGSVAGVLMTVIAAAMLRPGIARVLPGFREWRRVLSFGGKMSLAALVTDFGVSANDLIVGRLLGFNAVGLYSRAQGLINLFHRNIMGAIGAVAFPAFSDAHRRGHDLKEPYLTGVSYITVFAWPFFCFLGIMAYPVIRILFGPQWDAAVPLVQLLSIAAAVGAAWSLSGRVLLSMGEVNKILKAEIIIQSCRVFLILIAASYSIIAVAASQILVYAIGLFIYYRYLHVLLGISVFDVFKHLIKNFGITVFSSLVPVAVVLSLDIGPDNVLVPVVVAAAGAGVGWVIGVVLLRHPVRSEFAPVMSKILKFVAPIFVRSKS